MTLKKFSFIPRGEVKRTVRFLDRTIDFETGAFQVQRLGVNPITTFEMQFEGKQLDDLEAFYLEHRKSEQFLFDYNGEEYTCQFTSDYNPTEKWGFDTNGRVIGKTTVTIQMRVVHK